MIASTEDLTVLTEADYERLPEDGRWEVVNGRAILLPPNEVEHQRICDRPLVELWRQLEPFGYGYALSAAGVRIPLTPDELGEIRTRVPDLVVSRLRPRRWYPAGSPPELVIEVLATRRGNVERTEKLDDYARAGIGEYWIVNPIDRVVEKDLLRGGEYILAETIGARIRSAAFPELEIDLAGIWAVLDSY